MYCIHCITCWFRSFFVTNYNIYIAALCRLYRCSGWGVTSVWLYPRRLLDCVASGLCRFWTVRLLVCATSGLCCFRSVPLLDCAASGLCHLQPAHLPACATSNLCNFLTRSLLACDTFFFCTFLKILEIKLQNLHFLLASHQKVTNFLFITHFYADFIKKVIILHTF